jgi:hypothetical protein
MSQGVSGLLPRFCCDLMSELASDLLSQGKHVRMLLETRTTLSVFLPTFICEDFVKTMQAHLHKVLF